MSSFRIGLVQLAVTANKAANLNRAVDKITEASKNGAKLVSLPEIFNSPYGTNYFSEYAEPVPEGQSCQLLAKAAKDNGIFLIGGSIPERDGNDLFNTCTVWNPNGEMLAKYRKMHLFDIDIPGKITFKESEALKPGNEFVSFKTPWTNVGIGICYDMRFADLAQMYARNHDCGLLVYPGAFNMTTGPAHWEALIRARALDNQVYCAAVSPARDTQATYVAWGHSTLINPWGEIVAKTEEAEDIIYADIDLDRLQEVRQQVPITQQRRHDLYNLVEIQKR
eukprot:08121.XXX_440542_441462_1 [CDS] Oithona nana genome sequencing.